MSDTSSRLLALLSLLQSPRLWPGSELAERLGTSPRTVRRDIERLRDLGYPVQAARGGAGGYRLAAGAAMPPLLLDDEEAVAIVVGLRAAAGHAVDGIQEASVRALAKLEQVLPSRLRHRVRVLNAATLPLTWSGPSVDAEDLTALAAVIANRIRLRFDYRAADGTERPRLVEPHRLVAAGRRWYFVAYDNEREDWRNFRVDRMRNMLPTGARYAARTLPDADAAAFVARTLYDSAPAFQAVVTLHAPAGQMAARLGDAARLLEPIDEHSCRLRSHADTLPWLALRLAVLECEFEVHEPPELAEYLSALATRVARAAGQKLPVNRPS